jgi:hypothetical protein
MFLLLHTMSRQQQEHGRSNKYVSVLVFLLGGFFNVKFQCQMSCPHLFCSPFRRFSLAKQATQHLQLLPTARSASGQVASSHEERTRQKAERWEKRKKRKGSDAKESAKKNKGNSGDALKSALVMGCLGFVRADILPSCCQLSKLNDPTTTSTTTTNSKIG